MRVLHPRTAGIEGVEPWLAMGGHGEEGDKATSIWWIRDQFAGCSDSLESVFGSASIAPSEMTKKIWSYVKLRALAKKH